MMNWINKKRNQKGFTLIELIVVIAILGILAALAIPRLTGTQGRARDNAHQSNRQALASAANIAIAEHGYPSTKIEWSKTAEGSEPFERNEYIGEWPTSPWSDGPDYTLSIDTDGVVKIGGGKTGEVEETETGTDG